VPGPSRRAVPHLRPVAALAASPAPKPCRREARRATAAA
jgi:hypothetical protein